MNLTRSYAALCLLWLLTFGALLALCGWCAAHDIYTGVHGRDDQLCCGGTDCSATFWRERRGHYEFLTREHAWVEIPEDRITFLPVPGEPADPPPNFAHLCYRAATETDRVNHPENVFGDIFLYCAFIKPTGS